jgi:hypothetical protein
MKKIIAGLLIGSFGCFTSYAGTYGLPSQDTVVALIRAKFKLAKDTVKLEALKEGTLAKCKFYNAIKDDFDRGNASFEITEEFDGLWEGKVAFSKPGSNPYHKAAITFTRGYNEMLLGVFNVRLNGLESTLHAREDKDNIYLEEIMKNELRWIESRRGYDCSTSNSVSSITYENSSCHHLGTYYVCPKQQKNL